MKKQKMEDTARRPILKSIQKYQSIHGYSPCIRDIVTDLYTFHDYGFSTSHVVYHLDILEDEGYLTRAKNTPRSIVLTELGKNYD